MSSKLSSQGYLDYLGVCRADFPTTRPRCHRTRVVMGHALLRLTPPEREQRSKTLVAQVDSKPGEHRRCEWNEGRIQFPDSNVGGDCTPQVAREKHGAEHGRTRYH